MTIRSGLPAPSGQKNVGSTTLGLMLGAAWLFPHDAGAADMQTPATPSRDKSAETAEKEKNDARHRAEHLIVTGHVNDYQETRPHLDRILTKLVDTPQTIAEIPKELMQDQNTTNMLDALKTVPGISIAAGEGAQQGDNLSIRGFNAQNDFYRDGMLDFGSYYRDPFDLETVEVLKGPSGTLFGRGSTGGVINQATKHADMTSRTAGTLSFGTDATKRLTIDIDRSSNMLGGMAFRLNAMVHDAGIAGVNFGETRRYGIAPSLAFGLNTSTRVRIDYLRQQSYDSQSYGIPWLNGSPAPVSRSNFYGYDGDYLRSAVNIGTVRVEHDFSRHFTVHDQIRYSTYNTGQRAVEGQLLGYTSSTDIVPAGVPLSQIQVSRNTLALSGPSTLLDNQTEGNADFQTGILRHQIVLGLEEQRQTADITRYTYPKSLTSLLDPVQVPFTYVSQLRSMSGSVSNDLAPYLNYTLSIGRHWQILGGWRWDHYTTEYKQIVAPATYVTRDDKVSTWRGAIVYKPTEDSSIYFNYGTSFDPSGENISLTASTAAVAPEKSRTFEFGTKWNFDRLSLTAAAYRIEMTNVRETNPADATETILAGNYRSQGFELSASGHITPRWSVFGGYSYDDVTVVASPNILELGNQPPNAPKHTIAFWTEYHLPWLPVEVGGGVNYVSSRTASSLPVTGTTVIERAPGYTTAQLMVKYRINPNLSAQVNIANISNTYYYSGLHPTHIVVGPARSALFSLSASF
ncbi:TonB-dependent receptor [Gluconacetobacter tumulisoli]|uniref:TonB-dependent siderophore receptor n=1 Tax=Gluconacetobacter tumulisoli TaxID=1286189 RepID=A0A7W4K754_9PROT|nr:TonB-dependent siderophore receptor [Gluconacetobacter tumulisoli]MBB2201635.1 TonB-dependent siderophore receptor [Gluconacetobacter tumulisoli]